MEDLQAALAEFSAIADALTARTQPDPTGEAVAEVAADTEPPDGMLL